MSPQNNVDTAVQAARQAFPRWRKLTVQERTNYLLKFRDVVNKNREELATVICEETGKPFWEALGEADGVAAKVNISLKAYEERTGTKSEDKAGVKHILRHRPHGVVAVFGPFNFPAHLPNGHIIPALLAGNTCVFKPSELTPRTGQFLVDLWNQIKLPAGVLELVQGDRITGEILANHLQIDGLFFTGSVPTGLTLSQVFATHPEKILALELGGNNPMVVSQVQETEKAVDVILKSAFLTSGQRCTCTRRLILVGEQAQIVNTLLRRSSELIVGHYTDRPEPFMGPVINAAAAKKLLAVQKRLKGEGAEIMLEMRPLPLGDAYVSPGILDITHMQNRVDEEFFGPLLQIIRVNTFAEGIAEANNTKFGLAASLLSSSRTEWEQFRDEVRAGVINWNLPTTGASSTMPFGGIGLSGNHRPSGYYAADYCAYPVATMEAEISPSF